MLVNVTYDTWSNWDMGCWRRGVVRVVVHPSSRPKMPKPSIKDFGMWDGLFFASAQSLPSGKLGWIIPMELDLMGLV